MKNLNLSKIAASGVLLFIALMILPVSSQSAPKDKKGKKPIPENIMKIIDKSCKNCHSKEGNEMAAAKLNFTKWDKYSVKKQSKKSDIICFIVTEDKMPPEKFREHHPEAVLTKDEVKLICDWALSLQMKKK